MAYSTVIVGGKEYGQYPEFFSKFSGYFKRLFESPEKITEPIVIDRDPVIFDRLYDYMRNEEINFPENQIDAYEEEAKFFEMDIIVKICECARKGEFNIPVVNTEEEILAAVRDSQKKAVMIMTFLPDAAPTSVQIANCLVKYGHFMDVVFRHGLGFDWGIHMKIYDKTNFNVVLSHSSCYERTLWKECRHLLNE